MRVFDTTCGDLVNWANILLEWSYQPNYPGIVGGAIISGMAGATGNCIQLQTVGTGASPEFLRRNLPGAETTLTTACRFQPASLPSSGFGQILYWSDAGANTLLTLALGADGSLSFWTGTPGSGSPVGGYSPANSVRAGAWAHIAATVTYNGSGSGSITLRVNSQSILTASSVTTSASANTPSMFAISAPSGAGPASTYYFDDVYVNNSAGSINTGFDGDLAGLAFLPSAAGQYTQWSIGGSAPAATNWQSVNQVPPPGDASYVYAASTGLKDTYHVPALPANVAQIVTVTALIDARTDVTGLGAGAAVAPLIGNGTTAWAGTAVALNTSYEMQQQYLGTNPITTTNWAISDWSSLQIGQERTS